MPANQKWWPRTYSPKWDMYLFVMPQCTWCEQYNVLATGTQIWKQQNSPPYTGGCQECVWNFCMNGRQSNPSRDPQNSNNAWLREYTKTWIIRPPFNQACFQYADKGWCINGSKCYRQHGLNDPRCHMNFLDTPTPARTRGQPIWRI